MNIKKEGFTLVELLSVISLLAALALIVIPNINDLLKSSREDIYSKQMSSIITAAKLWATEEENMILLEENQIWPFVLTLGDLQDSGFIDEDIINSKTEEKISESLLIYIERINNKYNYSVDETSDDPLAPIITMNGDKVITLEIGTSYSDLGASAVKPDGTSNNIITEIKKKGVTTNINGNQKGIYTITYLSEYVVNGISHKGIAVRVLKYVDTTAPIITCSSCSNGTIIESTDVYTLPTVTVTDNSGENIKPIIVGSFSSKIPGNKTIKYQATDSSGNVGTLEVNYIVKDTIAPEFIYREVDFNTFEIIASDFGSGIKEYSFDNGITWQKSNIGKYNCSNSDAIFTTLVVKDYSDNIKRKNAGIVCKMEYTFDYTGNEQVFNVPVSGLYKLEVWGAQGGNITGNSSYGGVIDIQGGYGGYSLGVINLVEPQSIFINVGGSGAANCRASSNGTNVYCNGGYNGGGNGLTRDAWGFVSGGGGATHIALSAGLLSTFSNDRSDLLIVAGGGGGSLYYNYSSANKKGYGGAAGGFQGTPGYKNTVGTNNSVVGTQTSGNAFGLGISPSGLTGNAYDPGGGGGFYGGGNVSGMNSNSGAGGGSGYIGNTLLTDKYMYCYNCTPSNETDFKTYTTTCANEIPQANCSKIGNGYVRITYLVM